MFGSSCPVGHSSERGSNVIGSAGGEGAGGTEGSVKHGVAGVLAEEGVGNGKKVNCDGGGCGVMVSQKWFKHWALPDDKCSPDCHMWFR